ncbi:hypothetical protein D9V87_03600 [Bacteroidetes/Chlorobi group bacterium MS-B_bin-24]|jgi:hypothetical protein|nr:MAG: hypothetical protein D9V87_03600 [Bacteroidetes/Chlorobi group bacterium MS-B_bin-24]
MNAKSRSRKPVEAQLKRLGPTQVIIFLGLLIFFFIFFFRTIIPWGVAQFVVPLFKPGGDKLEKIGFVKFNGLVWASTTKEKAEEIIKQGGIEISKDLINKEYIFDFTFKPRNEKEHGYVKESLQFYVKSEVIGENAIILDPELGFSILALDLALVLAVFLTMVMPTKFGFMSLLFDRQIDNTKTKIRLQTGFPEEVVEILVMPDDQLMQKDRDEVENAFRLVWERTIGEEMSSPRRSIQFEDLFDETTDIVKFRNITLYSRIKDYFSDFVLKEIEDTKDGLLWRRNHFLVFKGLRLYMAHHFTEKYSNNVTGLAYGGAAFLIVAVGIRGLKFIPATKPSFILLAIFLEFTMLLMLSITLIYTEEEERMDRMLKKMEDANKSQLEALRSQQYDIHQLTSVLVGQSAEIIKSRVEKAISEYLTSDDHVKRMIAEEISQKILIGLKESFLNQEEK